jgi:hypothetical protein
MRTTARILGVLTGAFILTSAVMFWLPFLQRTTGWYYDTSFDFYPDVYGDYSPDTEALRKLSPLEERQLLDEISGELKQKSNSELYQLKPFEDLCVNNLVDCRGLTSIKVKPFIDAILADRQTAETALYARAANFISGGSLFISFIALIFAGLTYRRKRAT